MKKDSQGKTVIKRYERSISEKDGDRTANEICSGSMEPSYVSIFKIYIYEYMNLIYFFSWRYNVQNKPNKGRPGMFITHFWK